MDAYGDFLKFVLVKSFFSQIKNTLSNWPIFPKTMGRHSSLRPHHNHHWRITCSGKNNPTAELKNLAGWTGGEVATPKGSWARKHPSTEDLWCLRDAPEFESEMPQIFGFSTLELLVGGFWTCNEITPPKYRRTNKNTKLQKSKLQLTRQTRQLPSAISKRVTGHPAIVVGAKEHLGQSWISQPRRRENVKT